MIACVLTPLDLPFRVDSELPLIALVSEHLHAAETTSNLSKSAQKSLATVDCLCLTYPVVGPIGWTVICKVNSDWAVG